MQVNRLTLVVVVPLLVIIGVATVFVVWSPRYVKPSNSLKGKILRDFVYRTVNGVAVKMDIYYPEEIDAHPLPVTVYIHGGGWTGGDKRAGEGIVDARVLLTHGFVVVSINYRLAPTYRFPAQIEDVKCAIRYLRAYAQRYHLDPERIGVFGGSAGGHLAALLGVADEIAGFDKGEYLGQSSRVRAVVDMFGPTNLTLLTSDPDHRRLIQQVFGSVEILKQASPVTHVSKDDPPFLILHGDKDPVVPLNQSTQLYERLRTAGVPVTLVVVKNAGHGFTPVGGQISPTRSDLTQLILDFFEKHLR